MRIDATWLRDIYCGIVGGRLMFSAIISDSFLMSVDDMMRSMVQRVHVVKIDLSIVQWIAVFVVRYHSRRCLCYVTVHSDFVGFSTTVFFAQGIPAMTRLDRIPLEAI